MNKFISSGLLVIGFMGATSAYADNYQHRQYNHQIQRHHQIQQQAQRIHHGVRTGNLTRAEAGFLAQQQQRIYAKQYAYKADGRYTHAERRDVRRHLQYASNNIYQQQHDSNRTHHYY